MSTLSDAVLARSAELVDRSVTKMYEHPFWLDRFGERGLKHTREDGRFHVTYLAQALAEATPGILTGYARWLQGVLTRRGMCSLHLFQHFERLGEAISALGIPDASEAHHYLALAQQALRYDESATGPVIPAIEQLVPKLQARLGAELEGAAPIARRLLVEDLPVQLSYLVDAVAMGTGQTWASYRDWLRSFLERSGVPSDVFARWDTALREALATVPKGAQSAVEAVLPG